MLSGFGGGMAIAGTQPIKGFTTWSLSESSEPR
jgi:hypothetical protein